MYDDLTEGDLPDPENEAAKEVLHDVIDIVSAQASTKGKAAELKDILKKPHFQVRERTGRPWHHIIPYIHALRYDLVIDCGSILISQHGSNVRNITYIITDFHCRFWDASSQ